MKRVVSALPDDLLAAAARHGIPIANADAPRTGTIKADGLQLSFLDWGGPTERPVVFVHGGGLTSRTWDFVCLALRGEFRCIALDLRGHGDSHWAQEPDAYTLDSYARDIQALVGHLELTRCTLVGMSLGGHASIIAAAESSFVAGLALVDVGPEPDHVAVREILRGIREPATFDGIDDVVDVALKLNPRRSPDELRNSLRHNLRELPEGRLAWKYDWRAFEALTIDTLNARTEALWRAVDVISCPVLIIRGSESDILPADAADKLRARLRDARVAVVEAAGHTVQGDNPAGLVSQLGPFLRSCLEACNR
jgi:esterase